MSIYVECCFMLNVDLCWMLTCKMNWQKQCVSDNPGKNNVSHVLNYSKHKLITDKITFSTTSFCIIDVLMLCILVPQQWLIYTIYVYLLLMYSWLWLVQLSTHPGLWIFSAHAPVETFHQDLTDSVELT